MSTILSPAQAVWETSEYYRTAHKGSLDRKHPGMKILASFAKQANSILDLGCGEGTRLSLVAQAGQRTVGVDISSTAIKLAKQNHPNFEFLKADLEKLSFGNDEFDLVYCAFVLEHLANPEKAILEAIRVTNKYLVFIAPNFGAPNRASPPFKGSRIRKFVNGFFKDLIRPFVQEKRLKWGRVEPIATPMQYEPDWDTTVEPYLGSLLSFLRIQKLTIKEANSCWSEELPTSKIHQRISRFLGELGIYPFWLWGPHLVLVAQKNYG